MAQNENPFFEQQPGSLKQTDETKKPTNDSHAVSKR